jgi:exopolysaccharide production protein ExoQ
MLVQRAVAYKSDIVSWRRSPPYSTESGQLNPARDRRKKLPWLLFFFLYVVIINISHFSFTFSAEPPALQDTIDLVTTGDLTRQLFLLVLGLFGIHQLTKRSANQLNGISKIGVVQVLLLAVVCSSFLWSDDPFLTLKRVVALATVSLGALALARKLSWRELVIFTFAGAGATLILSIGAELYLGTFTPLSGSYRFSGVMHPNAQGFNCATLLVSAYIYSKKTTRYSVFYKLSCVFAIIFLVLTKSRTSLIAGTSVCLICYVLLTPNVRKALRNGALLAAISLGFLFTSSTLFQDQAASTLLSLGRDDQVISSADELTGRLPLWHTLLSYSSHKPILGYGYDSFWTPDRIYYISTEQGWRLNSAHSGYLEVLLSLGVVGLLAVLIILFGGLGAFFLSSIRTKNIGPVFGFSLLLLLLINMSTEGLIFGNYLPCFICKVLFARLAYRDGLNTASDMRPSM